ncbi:unnamed protein product [Rhizoctonia solani]|uniref:Uncharacterized protein n=1 Tax=Rhizoctonia solani TaxID=456999 RepID=A0A8H3GGN0_9AGAM|nr:unnamed protein product [Rhizoctonia solani]
MSLTSVGRSFRKTASQVRQAFHPSSILRQCIATKPHPTPQPSPPIRLRLRLPASPSGQPGWGSRLSDIPSLNVIQSTSTIQGTVLRATILRAHAPTLAEAVKKWASASRSLTQPIRNADQVSQGGQTDPSLTHESPESDFVDCNEFYGRLNELLKSSGSERIEFELMIDSPGIEPTLDLSERGKQIGGEFNDKIQELLSFWAEEDAAAGQV